MKRLARIFALLMLATFVAGTVVHAAATTEMSLHMTVAAAADADMNDCGGCEETTWIAVTCDQSCVQPLVALPVSMSADAALAPKSPRLSVPHGLVGRTGPPERHPPR